MKIVPNDAYLRIVTSTFLFALVVSVPFADAASQKKPKTKPDAQVKQAIIQESIEQYPGNCPCPYNTTRNGSRCGGRSAYSRKGGYSPICYPNDVTQEMIKEWRESHKAEE